MKKPSYRQCSFEKRCKLFTITKTAWIPEPLAVEGDVVKFKVNGNWNDGWVVKHVGARKTHEEIPLMTTLWKRHRKFSDI